MAARLMHVQPMAVVAPTPPVALHIGFMDSAGNWSAPEWTNDWSFSGMVSDDLAAPIAQWTPIFPTLEMYHGVLTFELDGSGPQLFCRGMFQPK